MKRLLIFLFLSALLFNWIGYQLYHSITEQMVNKNLTASPNQQDVLNPGPTPGRLPNFHIALYEKELDFDDLFEFRPAGTELTELVADGAQIPVAFGPPRV